MSSILVSPMNLKLYIFQSTGMGGTFLVDQFDKLGPTKWPWLYVNIQKFLTKALILLNFQLFSIGALGFFSGHCEGNGRNFVERMDRWSRQVAMGVRHAEALGRFWLDMHIFRGRKSDGFFGKKSGTVSSFTASCWSKFCSQTGIWIEGLFFYIVVAPNPSIGRAWWLDGWIHSIVPYEAGNTFKEKNGL